MRAIRQVQRAAYAFVPSYVLAMIFDSINAATHRTIKRCAICHYKAHQDDRRTKTELLIACVEFAVKISNKTFEVHVIVQKRSDMHAQISYVLHEINGPALYTDMGNLWTRPPIPLSWKKHAVGFISTEGKTMCSSI